MIRVALVLSASLMLSGCFVELLGATAITAEMQAKQATAAKRQLDKAKEFSAETTLRQGIQLYQADKGVNPPSLQALVPQYIAEIPAKPDGSPYGYDPATGALLDAPLPETNITTADYRTLDETRAAIYQYGQAVTWYPATLADLVPDYLAQYPMTSDGRDFIYDPQNGTVEHPDLYAPTPQPLPVRRQAISQPANATHNARGRAATQPVGGDYSNKQMDMVKELGF